MKYITALLFFLFMLTGVSEATLGDGTPSFSPSIPDTSDFPPTNLHNHFTAKKGLIVEGNRVTEWQDQGGNGYHVTVPVDKDPNFTGPRIDLEALNGFPVPKWLENSGMRLEIDSFSPDPSIPSTDLNMFYAVIKAPHTQGFWRYFWDDAASGNRQPLYTTYSDGRWWVRNGSNLSYVTAPDDEWVIVAIRYRLSSTSDQGAQVYINGELVSENPNPVRMSAQDGIVFGSRGGDEPPFSEREGEFALAERLHFDGNHTAEEQQQVEQYLSTEWGIALNPVIKPVITSPALGSENVGLEPMLQWDIDNSDTEFELVLGTEFNFSGGILINTVVSENSYQVPPGVLSYNTEYWWKVRSTNPDHTTWSYMGAGNSAEGGFAFNTGPEPTEPPGAVTLLSPADGSMDVSTDPLLSWQTVDQATAYRVQVSSETGFTTLVADEANLTATELSLSGLDFGTVYYWRVMAGNVAGDGPWSEIWEFTTMSSGTASDMAVSQQPTSATAGVAVSPAPSVTVTDGVNPVSGVTVNVSLTGATFTAGSETSAVTDINGVAAFSNLTIETAGSGYTMTFSSVGLSDVVSTGFDVNEAAANPASTTATVPAGTAGETTTITVSVEDAFGNPVEGQAGNLSATVSSGPNAGATLSGFGNDGGGSYSTSYKPTGAGEDEITISLNTVAISGSPYTSTISAGTASWFSFTSIPSPQTAGAPFEITVTVLDANSNKADSYNGTATLNTTAGTITPSSAVFTEGVATLSVDVTGVGTGETISALDGAVTGLSNTFTVDPGAVSASVSTVSATSPHTADGMDASIVTIAVQDANGNPISGFTNTDFTVDLGLTSASPGSVSEIGTSGTYTVDVTNSTAESVIVTITADGVILDESPEIIFQTGSASEMSVTQQPTATTAGIAISPTPAVTVTDGINPVSGVTVTARLNGAALTAGSSISAVTGVDGNAAFPNLAIKTAGIGYSLTFDADAKGVANVDSDPFDVIAASAFDVVEISGNGQAGEISTTLAAPFVVEVQDAFGNPVAGDAVDFSIQTAPAGATGQSLSVLSATTDVAGRAASSLTLGDNAGTYGVDALWNATTISFTATAEASAASSLQMNAQPGATTAGETIAGKPSVLVTDTGDNPVSGVTVSVSELGGYTFDAGTLTAVSDGAGVATFSDLMINATGDYTLEFSSEGLTAINSAAFDVTAAAASGLAIASGNNQSAQISQALAQDLTVEVSDAFSNPVSGITVNFAITSIPTDATGQSLSSASAVTGAGGQASVSFTLGDRVGDYIVDASSAGLTIAQFTATAATGDPSTMSETTQASLSTAGVAVSGPPSVTILDAGSYPVSGVNVTVSESGGYILDGGTLTVATNASGVAVFSDLIIETAGDYTLLFNAEAVGVADVTSGPFTVQAASASSIEISTIASPQTAGTPFSITLNALDDFGNVDESFSETADLTTTAGTVDPLTATFANGTVPLDVSVTQSGGSQTITATGETSGVTGTSNTFTVDPGAVSASASTVFATSPHTADGSDASTVTIAVQDANGNAVAGLTDTDFGVDLGASSAVAAMVAETAIPGTYRVSVTNTLAEEVTVSVTAAGVALEDTPVIDFQAGAVSQLTIVQQPQGGTAGVALTPAPAVQVSDGANPVDGVTVDVALTGATFMAGSETSATTDGSGVAAFPNLVIEAAGGGYTLRFSSAGLSDEISADFDVNPAVADAASTTATVQDGTAGVATTITVDVADAFGNPVEGQADNLAVTVSGGPNAGATVSGFTGEGGGSYTAGYTPEAAGEDELTITLGGVAIEGSPYPSTVNASLVSLLSPSDGSVNVSLDVILKWNALEGAKSYRVQVAEDEEFMTLLSDETGLTDTEYRPASLNYEATYYWRVLGRNVSGNLNWSEAWSFRTESEPISPPEVVSLLRPSNGSVDVPLDGLLIWQAVAKATGYRIQVSTDTSFTTIVEEKGGLTDPEYRPGTLDHATTYYWRVQAGNEAGEGDWSGTWSFQTVSSQPTETMIESVFPNPFNPTANIKYQLAENSEVLIEIFDMTGKRITVLINARQNRGGYTLPFSASGFSSGIYFVRLRAGNVVSMEKFTVIK